MSGRNQSGSGATGRSTKDTENGAENNFNPFVERKIEDPTTDRDTLAHLLKASLGTGILAMPCAFRSSGLALGIISTIVISFICTYCAYILVKCAHVLYYRTIKTQMSYADVAETALKVGPKPFQIFAKPLRIFVDVGLFVTYFGACIGYTVIVATSIQPVVNYYRGITENPNEKPLLILGLLLVPFILLTLIPNLKKLTPVSMTANVFMFISLCTILSWIIYNMKFNEAKNSDKFRLFGVAEPDVSWYSKYPTTFAITIFALGAIGVVMPLENKMMTPQNFIGPFGVLNKGMTFVTIMYMIVGVFGYLHDPASDKDMVMLEMPIDSKFLLLRLISQGVRILVASAVFCTYSLQFFVCLDISWSWIKKYFTKHENIANYILRIVLVFMSVILAMICPHIDIIMGLIGAFCLSIMGLLIPVVIESITFWSGDSTCRCLLRTTKNIVISIVAISALYFGTSGAFNDLMKILNPTE